MSLRRTMFHIQKYQIQILKKFLKLFLFFFPVHNTGGIQTCVDSSSLRFPKQFRQKGKLQQRFSPCGSDSSFSVKILIFLITFQNFIHCHLFSCSRIPGIWIVAVLASHRASLKKYQKTNSGTVNGPELSNECILPVVFPSLHCIMEGSGNNFILLFFCQFIEVYCIT